MTLRVCQDGGLGRDVRLPGQRSRSPGRRRSAGAGAGRCSRIGRSTGPPSRGPRRTYTSGQPRPLRRSGELARYSVLVGYIGWLDEPHRVSRRGCSTSAAASVSSTAPGPRPFARVRRRRSRATAVAAPRSGPDDGRVRRRRRAGARPRTLRHRRAQRGALLRRPTRRAFLDQVRGPLAPGGVALISVWRHAGDHHLWKVVDEVLPILDRVEVRNRANTINDRGWIVACCRPAND